MIATKVLRLVEAFDQGSNQREFNGVTELRGLLGKPAAPERFPTTFVRLVDGEPQVSDTGDLTWYDARAASPNRTEYRLYYPTNEVTRQFRGGDRIVLVRSDAPGLLLLSWSATSEIGQRAAWLLGIDQCESLQFEFVDPAQVQARLESVVSSSLEEVAGLVGIRRPAGRSDEVEAQAVLARVGGIPSTREMSLLAIDRVARLDSLGPDDALVALLDAEESLFRALEAIKFEPLLREAALAGLDALIALSLRVTNSRKSRAGQALQNHFAFLLHRAGIPFTAQGGTEGRSRPDFLVPSEGRYADSTFPSDRLAMIATKFSCKDRWRQILTEADRIQRKHLLTLEQISLQQLGEMERAGVLLVLPAQLHGSYADRERPRIRSVAGLFEELRGLTGR